TGFKWPTVTFLGWFGPRGLATIVFGLLAYEELGVESPVMGPVAGVIAFTVLISVFAHGVSAAPLSKMYGDWARRTHAPIESESAIEPMPSRGRAGL
ncbi:MAG TPA: sodium:proton antiporter, partial [Actinomycetota bacterium]|nr:sodium:proton antiporter [Actinomycetota bacterium]HNO15658.1 sodium:proton antiporter [Actinomycetota bacterium]